MKSISSALTLIGAHAILPEPPASKAAFYGATFPRLWGEVTHANPLTRVVGFQTALGEGRTLHVIGMEVTPETIVPEGLSRWHFEGDTLTFHSAQRTAPIVCPVQWRWRTTNGPMLGECTVVLPSMLLGNNPSGADDIGERVLFPSAHMPVDVTRQADDGIELVDPDPEWPTRFYAMRDWLCTILPRDWPVRIEHYGSTAIPGIPAKPIIDMLVEVPSFDAARCHILPKVLTPEWEYWQYADHMVLIRRDGLMGKRTHHVHLAPPEHRLWEGLLFRDALRADPEKARAYADLKRDLALRHASDREAYTDAKTAFVRAVTDAART